MRQQINLYQPIFRKQLKLFSSRAVGLGLVTVLVTLISIYAYGQHQVKILVTQVERLRAEEITTEARMTSLVELQGARANTKAIEEKIVALSSELALRSRALSVLQAGGAGQTTGFAARLEALARGHVDGLWLDHIVFVSERGTMSIGGKTINAGLVPRYLQKLSNEAALSGTRFDEFVIEGMPAVAPGQIVAQDTVPSKVDSSVVRFRAGSLLAVNDKPEGKP